MTQFRRVRNSLKMLLQFFEKYPPVFPPIITVTTYMSLSFPSPHFKCKLSSSTFGAQNLHICMISSNKRIKWKLLFFFHNQSDFLFNAIPMPRVLRPLVLFGIIFLLGFLLNLTRLLLNCLVNIFSCRFVRQWHGQTSYKIWCSPIPPLFFIPTLGTSFNSGICLKYIWWRGCCLGRCSLVGLVTLHQRWDN